MNDIEHQTPEGGFSLRRTFFTLLGGFAAFAVLTASYATADLQDPAIQPAAIVVTE